MYHQTVVKPNAEEVAIAATEWLIETIQECLAARGQCSIALSGGSTPKRLYQLIAENETESLDWSQVTLIWGDERNVPPEHVDSNFNMVREAWFDRLDPKKILSPYRVFFRSGSTSKPQRELLLGTKNNSKNCLSAMTNATTPTFR